MPTETAPFRAVAGGVRVELRVRPGASSTRVDGLGTLADGSTVLMVRVGARAEGGKANDAALRLLAKAWSLPRSALSLASGATARRKSLLVAGDPKRLLADLQAWLAGLPASD